MKPLEAKRNESTKRNGEESNLFKFNVKDHRAGTEIMVSKSTRKPASRASFCYPPFSRLYAESGDEIAKTVSHANPLVVFAMT